MKIGDVCLLVVERPGRALLVSVALVVVALYATTFLEFDGSYLALLPDDAPEVEAVHLFEEQVGSGGELVVAVSGPAERRLVLADRIVDVLRQNPAVELADHTFPVDFFEERALLLLDLDDLRELDSIIARASLAAVSPVRLLPGDRAQPWQELREFFRNVGARERFASRFESPDGDLLFVVVRVEGFAGDFGRGAEILESMRADIDAVLESPDEARLTGRLVVNVADAEVVQRDAQRASMLAMLAILTLLLLVTRRLWIPVILGVPLASGVLFTLALSKLLVDKLNMVSAFLVPLLLGLGVDYSIHIHNRFSLELRRGVGRREAMRRSIRATWAPCAVGALTTSAAFLVLVASSYRGISEYGLLTGIGVLVMLLTSFAMVPPLCLFLTGRTRGEARPIDRDSIRPLDRRLAVAMLVIALAATVAAACLLPRLGFETDYREMRSRSEHGRFYEQVSRDMGSGIDPGAIMVDGLAEARVLELLIRERMAGGDPGGWGDVVRVLSAASLVPWDRERKLELLASIRGRLTLIPSTLLDDREQQELSRLIEMTRVEPWELADVPETFRKRLLTRDGARQLVLMWPDRHPESDDEVGRWVSTLEAIAADAEELGIEATILDDQQVKARMNELLEQDVPRLILLASIVVLVLLLLHFRELKSVALVFGTLAAGVICLMGFMVYNGIRLDLFNVVVLPTVVGIGIDNGVHILHGHRREGGLAISYVVGTVGLAALLASTTTALGFGGLVLAENRGVMRVGLLALVGIAATFVTTTVALPALLRLMERRDETDGSSQ